MSDPTTGITAPAAMPPIPRSRQGIAAALLLSLALHAIVLLGLSEWSEQSPESLSIVTATLATASGSAAIPAPPAPAAEPQGEGPVAETLPDPRAAGANPASETSRQPATNPIAPMDAAPEGPTLDYAATVRQIVNLDSGNAGMQPRIRRIVEDRTETSEDDWYLESWRRKVERIGKLNYPDEARARKIYGNLRLLVVIEPDGTLRDVRVVDSSGHEVLDDAAVRIVRLAAPYAPFPPAMREDTDVLEIVRTWQFKKRGSNSPS